MMETTTTNPKTTDGQKKSNHLWTNCTWMDSYTVIKDITAWFFKTPLSLSQLHGCKYKSHYVDTLLHQGLIVQYKTSSRWYLYFASFVVLCTVLCTDLSAHIFASTSPHVTCTTNTQQLTPHTQCTVLYKNVT